MRALYVHSITEERKSLAQQFAEMLLVFIYAIVKGGRYGVNEQFQRPNIVTSRITQSKHTRLLDL